MNIIVTTTINKPTKAILRFANLKSWHLIVVVDKKTPLQNFKRLKNITLLKCEDQQKISSKLSKLIGWNSIQRRNFGFIEAKKLKNFFILKTIFFYLSVRKSGASLHKLI